tara:strand:- start:659 stop:2047 length:1389 start_codon:yes stop_codon:yes gene_type:complete
MKADKTLVAGAAATVQKTLDMAPIFKGVAELQMQQQEFMSSIFEGQLKRKRAIAEELNKAQIDALMRGGKNATKIHTDIVMEENNLNNLAYIKEDNKNWAEAMPDFLERVTNSDEINYEATYEGSLEKSKAVVNDVAVSYNPNYDNNDPFWTYSTYKPNLNEEVNFEKARTSTFEVRPNDLSNNFGVVFKDKTTKRLALAGVNDVLKQRTYSSNFLREKLLQTMEGDSPNVSKNKIATLMTTEVIEGLPTIRALLQTEEGFNKILPESELKKIGLTKPADKADFVDALTQPGHPNFNAETSEKIVLAFFDREVKKLHGAQDRFRISGSMMDNLSGSGRVQVTQDRYELPGKMTQVFNAMESGADFDYLGYNFSLDSKNGWYDKTEKNRKKDDPFTYYTFEELKGLVDPESYLELYDEFKDINPTYSIGSANKTTTSSNQSENGNKNQEPNRFMKALRFFSRF